MKVERGFVRDNGLTLFFLTICLASLVGQAFVGHSEFNHTQIAHQDELAAIRKEVKPHNVLLVLDAMTGQDAVSVAEAS